MPLFLLKKDWGRVKTLTILPSYDSYIILMPHNPTAAIKKTTPPSMGTQWGQQLGLVPPPGAGGGAKPILALNMNKKSRKILIAFIRYLKLELRCECKHLKTIQHISFLL